MASSVPNLKPEKVTLTDTSNRTLAAGAGADGFNAASAEEARGQTEAQLQARIKDIVETRFDKTDPHILKTKEFVDKVDEIWNLVRIEAIRAQESAGATMSTEAR